MTADASHTDLQSDIVFSFKFAATSVFMRMMEEVPLDTWLKEYFRTDTRRESAEKIYDAFHTELKDQAHAIADSLLEEDQIKQYVLMNYPTRQSIALNETARLQAPVVLEVAEKIIKVYGLSKSIRKEEDTEINGFVRCHQDPTWAPFLREKLSEIFRSFAKTYTQNRLTVENVGDAIRQTRATIVRDYAPPSPFDTAKP